MPNIEQFHTAKLFDIKQILKDSQHKSCWIPNLNTKYTPSPFNTSWYKTSQTEQ